MLSIFPIQPELISVHIPKTAGSTFHAVLAHHYGWRLKHLQRREDFGKFNNGKRYKCNKPFVKAVHGHILPHENWKRQYKKAKWVCWLRDPVDRLVSAYYHLEKTHVLGNDPNQRAFKELRPDLPMYVEHKAFKSSTRAYQRVLGRGNPEDFAFIGRTEHFIEDLRSFERIFNLPKFDPPTMNVGENKRQIDDDLRMRLAEKLAAEYDIYNMFIKHVHYGD